MQQPWKRTAQISCCEMCNWWIAPDTDPSIYRYISPKATLSTSCSQHMTEHGKDTKAHQFLQEARFPLQGNFGLRTPHWPSQSFSEWSCSPETLLIQFFISSLFHTDLHCGLRACSNTFISLPFLLW